MGTSIFIIGLLAFICGIAAVLVGSYGAKLVGVGVMAFGIIMVISSMATTVDARSVGIKTSMGKYGGALDPGFHMTAPWTSVEQWTTRNQTMRFSGDGKQDEHENFYTEPVITVRLGNQSQAYVDATITWKITEQSVGPLWQQYKTFDDARRDFATPAVLTAVNTAFDGYNPFKAIQDADGATPPASGTTTPVSSDDPTKAAYIPLEEWSKLVQGKLKPLYDSRHIDLVNVQVTQVTYDKRTEDKLRQYADAVADTRIAGQKVLTAQKDAEASAARATKAGVGCEALVRDLAAQDQLKNLPAGVQICSGVTGGAGVVVNGSK